PASGSGRSCRTGRRSATMNHESSEPIGPAEPELLAALRSYFGDAPDPADPAALERQITAAARFRLASRRRPGGWRDTTARWARIAVPAGLAAAVSLGAAPTRHTAPFARVILEGDVAAAATDGLPVELSSMIDEDLFVSGLLEDGSR